MVQHHQRQHKALPEHRHEVYQTACDAHPERWSGGIRNWGWIDQVQLNPDREMLMQIEEQRIAA
jgi:putative transposase